MNPATEQLFHELARHFSEPLLLVSSEGELLRASHEAQKLLALREDELQGRLLAELVVDAPEKLADYLRLCAQSMNPLPGAFRIRSGSGREVSCRCRGALLVAPAPGGAATILLRLSSRDEANRAFVLLNQKITDLSREVMNRQRAEQHALEALRLRDEFLSVASHELKTPLTSLSLKLQGLGRSVSDEPGSSVAVTAASLNAMRRQVKRLAALVDDLLDVSRISTGRLKLELELVELPGLVREMVARFEPDAQRAGCELIVTTAEPVVGNWDRLRLEQVLSNLVSNAIKYGAGKPIQVRVERAGTRARLVVCDEGIGIEPEALERIFYKFERAVSERHYGGLGLGLYVVRKIVEAMGGTVRAESTPGQGATFTVELPLSRDVESLGEPRAR
jgi:signal transduction histidine kinase